MPESAHLTLMYCRHGPYLNASVSWRRQKRNTSASLLTGTWCRQWRFSSLCLLRCWIKCNVALKDLKIIYQRMRCTILVGYVIPRICTVDGKFTLREQANNETIQRAWRINKMAQKCMEFKSTSTQSETNTVNCGTMFREIKYKTYH